MMSAWEDELDNHPEYIDEMLKEEFSKAENIAYCRICETKHPFYLSAGDGCYHCSVCDNVFRPYSRRDRRFDTKKHTW